MNEIARWPAATPGALAAPREDAGLTLLFRVRPQSPADGLAWGGGAGVVSGSYRADDLAAERESDPQRVWRSRGHGERGRGGVEAGDEAEESPSHEGAVRARGEASVAMQGVQRLSAREEAL